MKKTYTLFLMLCAALIAACTDYTDILTDIEKKIDDIEETESGLFASLDGLQAVIDAVSDGDVLTGFTPVSDGSRITEYSFTFADAGNIVIENRRARDGGKIIRSIVQDKDKIIITLFNGRLLMFDVPAIYTPEEIPAAEEPDFTFKVTGECPVMDYKGGTATVKLTTDIEYEVDWDPAADWLEIVETKEVHEYAVTFTVSENTSFNPRSAFVSFESGEYTVRTYIRQEGRPATDADKFNLSRNGTSNCYIVTEAGDWCFEGDVMGCGQSGIFEGNDSGFHTHEAYLEPKEAEIVWCENDVISDVRYEDGLVYFHASGNKGNALVSVLSRGTVIWSWHIWCTDAPAEVEITNSCGMTFTVLDRNLGAVAAEGGKDAYGLYYQWGRKDPFDAAVVVKRMYVSSTLKNSIKYPERAFTATNSDWCSPQGNNYLWGNPHAEYIAEPESLKKTIYDPCPAGYMVPCTDVFCDITKEMVEYTSTGCNINADNGSKLYMPYAGRVSYRCYDFSIESEPVTNSDGSVDGGLWATVWTSHSDWYAATNQITSGRAFRIGNSCTDKRWDGPAFYSEDRARCLPVRCVKIFCGQ